ncbi:recombinase family protein [Lactobacillus sp. DCY120]|uniref:Recombinase family protein n=1 Tax=Bombilactobacillus apium TaxID=2675299 RepID=A0A850R8Z9_9LACO|nr:recombinase family protein [Bombilactobacillus apium]NVY95876.1 recombinase family protein [Bombilactobacillus apium]
MKGVRRTLKVGYARVSSKSQNLARQIEMLQKAECKKIFAEKLSGKNMERPQLKELLGYIRDDDVVIVNSLDRLGRNSDDIRDILNQIKNKGATIDILNLPSFEGIEDTNLRNLLTNLVLDLMGYIAQSEREHIRTRQREGIEIAKKRGIYKGKAKEYSAHAANPQKRAIYHAIVRDLEKNVPILEISKKYGIGRSTVYRIKRELP